MLLSGTVQALSMNAQVGRDFTDIGIGGNADSTGLGFNSNWARSDHDGQLGNIGVDFSFPLDALTLTVGGKGYYFSPNDSGSGVGVGLGGGLQWAFDRNVSLYGSTYYVPEGLTSGVKSYNEADIGLRWNVFRPFNIDVGYRYMVMKGKDDKPNNTLADGVYLGVGLSF